MDSSSNWGLIIEPGQDPIEGKFGLSFQSSMKQSNGMLSVLLESPLTRHTTYSFMTFPKYFFLSYRKNFLEIQKLVRHKPSMSEL